MKAKPLPSADQARKRLEYFTRHNQKRVESIRQLVEIESPSDNKQAVDRLVSVLAQRLRAMGGGVRIHRSKEFGDHLQADFPSESRRKPVLLLGHCDTVYAMGTLAKMPCRVASGRLWGPGVYDMKAGIALMIAAIEGLRAWHGVLPRPVTVFLVSDEEVGSGSSRRITEALAKRSAAVLVCEPSYGPHGAVKTARKGVGEYRLTVKGVAAHAGLDFAMGQNAIAELARQITAVSDLVDLKRGLTVSAGLVEGGTRVNVVPESASASIDVRVANARDAQAIDRKLRSLKPFNRKCRLEVTGGLNRPPLERTAAVSGLYQQARKIARQHGWDLEEAAVGGGSDGNFTAALGIPTLDGLGAVGEGAHSPHESVQISLLPRQAALLAELIAAI